VRRHGTTARDSPRRLPGSAPFQTRDAWLHQGTPHRLPSRPPYVRRLVWSGEPSGQPGVPAPLLPSEPQRLRPHAGGSRSGSKPSGSRRATRSQRGRRQSDQQSHPLPTGRGDRKRVRRRAEGDVLARSRDPARVPRGRSKPGRCRVGARGSDRARRLAIRGQAPPAVFHRAMARRPSDHRPDQRFAS
jgi:hypothetical protein